MRALVPLVVLVLSLPGACADADDPGTDDRAAEPSSAQLEVRCDGVETLVMTPIVQAQPDGVHAVIHNVSDAEVLMQWEHGGDGAPSGDSRRLVPIPPGDARFRCQTLTDDLDPGDPGGWASFEVLEPPGWVSTDLGCAEGGVIGNLDHAPDAEGVSDPEADAREKAEGAEVVQAGYATAEEISFVAFDGDDPVMVLTYHSDGNGGWLLNTTSRCS